MGIKTETLHELLRQSLERVRRRPEEIVSRLLDELGLEEFETPSEDEEA